VLLPVPQPHGVAAEQLDAHGVWVLDVDRV
jgi:hypothetical protein